MLFGLAIGIVIGLVIGPLIRSWLAWREYLDASRESHLHEEILRRMSQSPAGEEGRVEGPRGYVGSP